jgi:hypothetical protein
VSESEPTREELLTSALEGMAEQFAYEGKSRGWPAIHTGGLSALEEAFDVLGWTDPHPVPYRKCQKPRCREFASCGTPTPDGYKRLCGKHYQEVNDARMAGAAQQASGTEISDG